MLVSQDDFYNQHAAFDEACRVPSSVRAHFQYPEWPSHDADPLTAVSGFTDRAWSEFPVKCADMWNEMLILASEVLDGGLQ